MGSGRADCPDLIVDVRVLLHHAGLAFQYALYDFGISIAFWCPLVVDVKGVRGYYPGFCCQCNDGKRHWRLFLSVLYDEECPDVALTLIKHIYFVCV